MWADAKRALFDRSEIRRHTAQVETTPCPSDVMHVRFGHRRMIGGSMERHAHVLSSDWRSHFVAFRRVAISQWQREPFPTTLLMGASGPALAHPVRQKGATRDIFWYSDWRFQPFITVSSFGQAERLNTGTSENMFYCY